MADDRETYEAIEQRRNAQARYEARREALIEAREVAYDAWNGLNGHVPESPYDGRTREGKAWSNGGREVFRAVAALVDDRTALAAPPGPAAPGGHGEGRA